MCLTSILQAVLLHDYPVREEEGVGGDKGEGEERRRGEEKEKGEGEGRRGRRRKEEEEGTTSCNAGNPSGYVL